MLLWFYFKQKIDFLFVNFSTEEKVSIFCMQSEE